jgi:ANTAR domain
MGWHADRQAQRLIVRYGRPFLDPDSGNRIAPILRSGADHLRADGAYLYYFNRPENQLELIRWSGPAPISAREYAARLEWFPDIAAPVMVKSAAWQDRRFELFPEFMTHGFAAVVSVPFKTASGLAGLANFCRRQPVTSTRPLETLPRAVHAHLGVLLENRRLSFELQRVERKLEDRKIVERAKRILQTSLGCTEEAAYGALRRTSQRNHVSMRALAELIIDQKLRAVLTPYPLPPAGYVADPAEYQPELSPFEDFIRSRKVVSMARRQGSSLDHHALPAAGYNVSPRHRLRRVPPEAQISGGSSRAR